MEACASCGEAPGDGAFCVRCGAPRRSGTDPQRPGPELPDDTSERLRMLRSDTAERPAVRTPPPPPPPFEPASHARFPLYADQPGPGTSGAPPVLPPMPDRATPTTDPSGPTVWIWWALVGVALLLAAGLGAWFALRDDGSPGGGADSSAEATATSSATEQPARRARSLTRGATARVPAVAAPNQDLAGRVTSYGPEHLLDGRPGTAWRMPGNGRGELITIRLRKRSVVTEVGLINGYAKVADGGRIDWYPRNRRILEVRWSFDDGSVVDQSLRERPTMQTVPVDSERTRTIRLRLLKVSAPGGRDFTAISEIGVWGR